MSDLDRLVRLIASVGQAQCLGGDAAQLGAEAATLASMAPFHAYFSEIAEREMRTVSIEHHHTIPPGKYLFVELYCARVGCDCRNTVLWVCDPDGARIATINHALDPDGFKRIGAPRTFLDPLNAQSRYSKAFLDLFVNHVLDDTYSERLERHWRMMKERVNGAPGTTIQSTPASADPATMLDQMGRWPQSWTRIPEDMVAGVAIVDILSPFFRRLADENMSKTTLRRHYDNLRLLGGELIGKLNQDRSLREAPAGDVIRAALDEEGPLLPSASEADRRDFDATCRKLRRFLHTRAATC
jgi:hypothetical protein